MSECYDCIWNSSDGCTEWECNQVTRAEAKERMNIVKCGNCTNWQTGIAYSAVGKCKLHDRICNRNYYCADGRKKMADKCRDKEWHEAEYIERETVLDLAKKGRLVSNGNYKSVCNSINSIPAADVRPVVVCANCEHNNHCLTQEFVDDCGKTPLDRNTFFCADGERRSNA